MSYHDVFMDKGGAAELLRTELGNHLAGRPVDSDKVAAGLHKLVVGGFGLGMEAEGPKLFLTGLGAMAGDGAALRSTLQVAAAIEAGSIAQDKSRAFGIKHGLSPDKADLAGDLDI